MRIRGYDETDEGEVKMADEEYQNLKGKIADLTKVNGKGGVSLFRDAAKTEFKSTYEILRDIHEVYDDLSDKTQAQLLEALGGKRGGNIIAGTLRNWEAVEEALENMENSAGSADRELEVVQNSLDYRLNNLTQTWVSFTQSLVGRDFAGGVIDGLTGISEAVQGLIGLLNNIPGGALPSTIGAFLGIQNTVKGRGAGKIFPVLMEQAACNAPFTGYRDFRRYGWGIYPAQNTRYCPNGRAA